MVDEGMLTLEEAFEVGSKQEGEYWNEAIRRSMSERAIGQTFSSLLGVGFKPRSESDMEIDRAFNDYFRTMEMRDGLSPAEFKQAMASLNGKYPFLEILLMSRKGGDARDTAYAYNVLGRIPPGSSEIVSKFAGIPRDIIDKFYDDKGRMTDWEESDKQRFMAGINDLAAVMAIPSESTRQDWAVASGRNSEMRTFLEEQFGDDIWDKIDGFYTALDDDMADEYLALLPEVASALDLKAQLVMTDETLSTYYGGLKQIEDYWSSVRRDQIVEELGTGIYDVMKLYWNMKDTDYKEARLFRKQHPEIDRYYEIYYDIWQPIISQQIIDFGSKLEEGLPATLRDVEPMSFGQEQIMSSMEGFGAPQVIPIETWMEVLGRETYNQVIDLISYQQPLDQFAVDKLESLGGQTGMSVDEIVQMVKQGLSQYIAIGQ
jgi:hypothetical protein